MRATTATAPVIDIQLEYPASLFEFIQLQAVTVNDLVGLAGDANHDAPIVITGISNPLGRKGKGGLTQGFQCGTARRFCGEVGIAKFLGEIPDGRAPDALGGSLPAIQGEEGIERGGLSPLGGERQKR